MMEILLRLDLKYKICQGSRRAFHIKVLIPFQGSTKVKGLHPILRMKSVVVLTWRSLLRLNKVRNMNRIV